MVRMGTDDRAGYPADGEGPVRRVRLRPFFIDTQAVSNERFAAFVAATGHVTDAERFGWSFVFAGGRRRHRRSAAGLPHLATAVSANRTHQQRCRATRQ
jgi:formylglycine-generating enzyme required for sulfatase activity